MLMMKYIDSTDEVLKWHFKGIRQISVVDKRNALNSGSGTESFCLNHVDNNKWTVSLEIGTQQLKNWCPHCAQELLENNDEDHIRLCQKKIYYN